MKSIITYTSYTAQRRTLLNSLAKESNTVDINTSSIVIHMVS